MGLKGLDEDEVSTVKVAMSNGGLFIIPLLVLSVALVMGYSPTYVAAFASLSVIAVAAIKPSTRMGLKSIWEALGETTLRMVSVTAACAAAGLVIGGISMTGLGGKFADLVFMLAGNSSILVLIISAILAIILGMGMPTPSAFILAAVLVGPTLSSLDFSAMQSNMFILYFAVLSAMTPPVAVAAFAASAIADAKPLGIAVGAVKLAITAFVVPFAFMYGEGLLLEGPIMGIILNCLTATIGVIVLSAGIEGYWKEPLSRIAQAMLLVAGLMFLAPNIIALGVAVALVVAAVLATPHLRNRAKTA